MAAGNAQNKQDAIVGKWQSTEKNLIVEVYKQGTDFKAKVIWFHDNSDTITPCEQRLDIKNPDKALRTKKIVGLDVLNNLVYDAEEDKWIDGKIYDSSSGKTWDATVWLTNFETLSIRGYYVFRFVGKTMKFTRM